MFHKAEIGKFGIKSTSRHSNPIFCDTHLGLIWTCLKTEQKQLFRGVYSNEVSTYLWRSYVSVLLTLQIYFLYSI